MTFEQLEMFLAIGQYDTFFDAAEALHTTQPTLSKQIAKLERELDLILLDRSRRSASFTKAGQVFYQEAEKLWADYQHMLLQMDGCRKKLRLELRLGALPILSLYDLTGKLKKFQELHPEISLLVEEAEEPLLRKGFEENRYDLVIARDRLCPLGTVRSLVLDQDELIAVLSPKHPLAGRASLTLEELAREPLILMNPYTSIYELSMELFAGRGLTPQVLHTARVETILGMAAVGNGIGLLARQNFQIFRHSHVKAVPLCPAVPLSVALMQKKKGGSEAAGKLVRFFAQVSPESKGTGIVE